MTFLKPKAKYSKGMAIIFVVGTLFLLSTLAISFAKITTLERRASSNHVSLTNAHLLAEAGLSRAINALREFTINRTYTHPQDEWIFHGNDRNSSGVCISPEKSIYPSYWWIKDKVWVDGETKPEPVPVYGRSVSGVLRENTHTYTLKIFDTSSQLDLNSQNSHIATILDNLGQAIFYYDGNDPIAGRGELIIARRTMAGGYFLTKEDLISIIGEKDFKLLQDYVTVNAWVDPVTLSPDLSKGAGYFIPEPRAPVNINTAPKPILTTLLYGLTNGIESIDFTKADLVASEIIKFRESKNPIEGAFLDWNQFDSLIDSLIDDPRIRLTPTQAGIIKTNANPNVTLKKFNPDSVMYPKVDKTDLLYHTTEFSFVATGNYEIISQGRVTNESGETMATYTIRAIAKINDFSRHNSQSDFMTECSSDLTDHTATFPNNVNAGHLASSQLGYVQLLTDEGKILSSTDLTFMADYNQGFSPSASTGSPVVYGSKSEVISLTDGGDLSTDGVLFYANQSRQLMYDSLKNMPLEEGVLTFWIKYNANDNVATTPIFYSCNPITSETGIQMDIRCSIASGNLYLIATRLFYVKNTYSPEEARLSYPIPYQNEKTEIVSTIKNRGVLNEWIHVTVAWWDGTNLDLKVDGEQVGQKVSVLTNSWEAYEGIHLYNSRFYIGGYVDSDGTPYFKNITIDDIRIYKNTTALSKLGIPSKYEAADPNYLGLFLGAFQEQSYPIKLGPINWTVRYPKSQWGQEIPYWLIPSMVTSLGKEDRITSGGSNLWIPIPNDWRNLKEWLKLWRERLKIWRDRRRAITYVVEEGKKPGGELSALVSNEGLYYEIRFTEGEQGIPNPLNVSPVIDDIMMTWQGPVKILYYSEDRH